MALSGMLLKPLGKMNFSKVRNKPRCSKNAKVYLKTQDLGRNSKEW